MLADRPDDPPTAADDRGRGDHDLLVTAVDRERGHPQVIGGAAAVAVATDAARSVDAEAASIRTPAGRSADAAGRVTFEASTTA